MADLYKVLARSPYYRDPDGGEIDKLDSGAIVEFTNWIKNGMSYIKLGVLSGGVWTASGKTGWINSQMIAPYTPPAPPPPPAGTDVITIAAHSVMVEINGEQWEYWFPQVTLEKVGG